jgi:hypothetical protein
MRGREWAGPTGRYGAAGESGAWKVAYEHYYWDRLSEAYSAVSELGAGSGGHGLVGFRMIEGEWITRERGVILPVNDWLTIEVIPQEVGSVSLGSPRPDPLPRRREPADGEASAGSYQGETGLPSTLVESVVGACDEVAARFGFEHGPPVLLSVLARESNVPWMPGRHGYCIDKHPYDKICVPSYALHDREDLEHVVQHEYAHVVSLNLSQGRCPLWLDEAVAMVAGGGIDRRAWRLLESGVAEWRDARDLDAAFRGDREDEGARQAVWLAYQQSAVIGHFLASLDGDAGLGRLLRGFSNNTLVQEILMRARGQSAADEALREVYGFGVRELFSEAKGWLSKRTGSQQSGH